ncbi:MAG: (Fe-S)-binding protein [Bacteroidetes bacterium]|nr:(Fe-S)-binding protein [Bacteroidota bacterium]MDA0888005.1 (Fe-S)-binding protein [Bacteroidota bacterium]MDA1083958.1 (Fe-S)-binding protein [Bacteroidota bacterium]
MTSYIPNIAFAVLFVVLVGLFTRNVRRIIRNIKLGKSANRLDQPKKRWLHMARIALGQSKMVRKPLSGALHVIVYVGFVVINIELLEIVLDGFLGTHRVFAPFLGSVYDALIFTFEIFAALVLISVFFFWTRRNIVRIKRFWKPEMKGWPKWDADIILYAEVVLMGLFLTMNASDYWLQTVAQNEHYILAGSFPVSQLLLPLFDGMTTQQVIGIERTTWWLHISGILLFLNYLYYSKHLHIILAFPNTYFAKLSPQGELSNMEEVTKEVALMLDPEADPYAAPPNDATPSTFGAADVTDLNWVQLMNAYSCTECGRCTDECPANQTGKLLSPRKIMMDTRDRLTEIGSYLNKGEEPNQNTLLDTYISREELWACTSCNACVEACPIAIDPLSIIMEMRRYLVMEQSAAPNELNVMMTNVENNGAPWPFNQQDRIAWREELIT